jgi:hypothetical protein
MRVFLVLLTLIAPSALGASGLLCAQANVQDRGDEQIAILVARLGSKQFAEREQATKALDQLGAAALAALRTASRSPEPEVRRRAELLVNRIERRLDTAQLLAPKRVRLAYKDTPVRDILADLAKSTGFPLRLEDDAKKLADKRITLQTGEVTFWEALDRVCAQAGLVEREPPAQPPPMRNGITGSVVVIGGGAANLIKPSDVLQPATPEKPAEIVLGAGPSRSVPTARTSAVRISASPAPPVDGELVLQLELTPQPTLGVPKILGVLVTSAVDDQGQHLKQRPTPLVPAPPPDRGRGGVVIINGQVIGPEEPRPIGNQRHTTVRLAPGSRPAQRLTELSGSVSILAYAPAEALVVVDNVLKANGRTAKGAKAGVLHVIEVRRDADGQVKLRFEAEPPSRLLSDGSAPPPNRNIIINGQPVGGKEDSLSAVNFALLDAKGRSFDIVTALSTGKRAGNASEYEFVYRSKPGLGEPFRFVYTDRRSAVIEVPFTLTDVPLR